MSYITWAIRFALFVVLLAFAVRNTEPVTLRFYFDLAWQAPLVALLLAFFAANASSTTKSAIRIAQARTRMSGPRGLGNRGRAAD